MARRAKTRPGAAGFTLIEISIVVAILGILAAVATPWYLTYTYRSRTAEPRLNLNIIRQAHTLYWATHDCYMSTLPNPAAIPSGTALLFDVSLTGITPCTPGASIHFNDLGLDLAGPVWFQYQCERLDVGTGAGFACDAEGDVDGDGVNSVWVVCSDTDEDFACDGPTAKGNLGALVWAPHRTSVERF